MCEARYLNSVTCSDGIAAVRSLSESSVHLILSDIPYGIGVDEWDVLHNNTNSALLGASPAQIKAGAVFKRRGKPLNGWSEADRQIPLEYQRWCSSFAGEWLRVLKPGGSALVFAGRRLAHRCIVAFEDAGFTFKDSLAWLRESAPHRAQRLSVVFRRRGDATNADGWEGWRIGNLRPIFEPVLWFVKPYPIGTTIADNVLTHGVGAYNEQAFIRYERSPNNVLRSGFSTREGGQHVAQKPVRLLKAIIELTTLPGQVVLDPFCGSGSTLVAAKATGRHYIGFENDEECARIAQRRLAPDMFDLLAKDTGAECASDSEMLDGNDLVGEQLGFSADESLADYMSASMPTEEGGEDYLAKRAVRGDKARFMAAMAQAAEVEPMDEQDRL